MQELIRKGAVAFRMETGSMPKIAVSVIEIALATYKGSYEQLTTVNQMVANWVNDKSYEFNGALFCIYHANPAQNAESR